MLFYEPLFLFLFAPAVYLLYWLFGAARCARTAILLLASVFFYAWSEPIFVLVVFASVALDLLVARRIFELAGNEGRHRERSEAIQSAGAAPGLLRRFAPRNDGAWLALGVVANLAILVYYKYAGFFAFNLDALARALTLPGINIPQIALPIGVSFVVFEKITYLVDVYRGIAAPARSTPLYALYVFFFPKLLAGPIIKYHDIAGQMETCPHADLDDFVTGFSRFMLGVAKKLLLADALASGADMIFAKDAATLGFAEAWWGVIFFTLQIYFDFSGYSDMAIGLARIFGFRLLENFDSPYVATSISEFWRRWHMSLTSWIKEYLYFPLGGNRLGDARTHVNLWVCFLASGIWHGAAWTYVVWGAYNGFFLVADRLFLLRWLARAPAWLANLATLVVVMAGWTIFRAGSLMQALDLLALMARPWAAARDPVAVPSYLVAVAAIAAAICLTQRVALSFECFDWAEAARRHALFANSALAILFVAALAKGLADPFKPFIYFRF